MTRAEARALTESVLDTMDITDSIYHQLAYTRPLVEELVWRVGNATRDGRVLVVGGNSLLGACLVELGCKLDLWKFGEHLLNDALTPYVRGAVTPEQFVHGCLPFEEAPYRAVVLPLVLEHLPCQPQGPLQAMRRYLHRDGRLVLATRNLANLGLRLRAARGQAFLPVPEGRQVFFSVSWPDLEPQRFYLYPEVAHAARLAGYVRDEAAFVTGRTPYEPDAAFGPLGWVSRLGKHAAKQAVPSLRDYIVASYRHPTEEELRTGAAVRVGDPPPDDADGSYQPTVTVVLPTHNRAQQLEDCFSGLLRQTYPHDRFDVVLINDASRDTTEAVATRLVQQAPFKVRYVRTPGLGATGARNLGMRLATGDIVAHLDDDNRPTPEWIEEAVRAFADPTVAVVGGPVLPKPEQLPAPFLSFTATYDHDSGIYPTSNVFYRRSALQQAGEFDESFGGKIRGRPVPGWDADLAWRILRQGYTSRFLPGVLAYQEVLRQSAREWVADAWRASLLPETVRRVPEMRKHLLYRGLFLSHASARFDLALVGTALALWKRRPEPLLLSLPLLTFLKQSVQFSPSQPRAWPRCGAKAALLVLRLATSFVALALGSLRAKEPVL